MQNHIYGSHCGQGCSGPSHHTQRRTQTPDHDLEVPCSVSSPAIPLAHSTLGLSYSKNCHTHGLRLEWSTPSSSRPSFTPLRSPQKVFPDDLLSSTLSLFPASLLFVALIDNLKLHFYFFTGFTRSSSPMPEFKLYQIISPTRVRAGLCVLFIISLFSAPRTGSAQWAFKIRTNQSKEAFNGIFEQHVLHYRDIKNVEEKMLRTTLLVNYFKK